MMSASALYSVKQEAARRARRQRLQLLRIPSDWESLSTADRIEVLNSGVPNFGSYRPDGDAANADGWYIDRLALVDKGSVGDKGMSLSLEEFTVWARPGDGLAMIEEGQFQVVVAAFRPGPKPTGHKVDCGVGIYPDCERNLAA